MRVLIALGKTRMVRVRWSQRGLPGGGRNALVLVRDRAGGAGEVVDLVAFDHKRVDDVVPDQFKVRVSSAAIPRQMSLPLPRFPCLEGGSDVHPVRESGLVTGEEVVDHGHIVSGSWQCTIQLVYTERERARTKADPMNINLSTR